MKLALSFPPSCYKELSKEFNDFHLIGDHWRNKSLVKSKKEIWFDTRLLNMQTALKFFSDRKTINRLLVWSRQEALSLIDGYVHRDQIVLMWRGGGQTEHALTQQLASLIGYEPNERIRSRIKLAQKRSSFFYSFRNLDELRLASPSYLFSDEIFSISCMGINLSDRERKPKKIWPVEDNHTLTSSQYDLLKTNIKLVKEAAGDKL